jgi:hypothetical protein
MKKGEHIKHYMTDELKTKLGQSGTTGKPRVLKPACKIPILL